MLILSRVCAEFTNRAGKTIFSIGPQHLLTFLNAPEEIQEDPLFALMMADGSLEAVRSVAQQRDLESDPTAGITREGKKAIQPSENASTPADTSTPAEDSATPDSSDSPDAPDAPGAPGAAEASDAHATPTKPGRKPAK